jgi:transcriptional regulator with XRE-family HTH domain
MVPKTSELGSYLRSLREANSLTLREVEKRTGISNPMLSQLESGRVKQPSPVFLYKLAEVYGVPYETLMEKAGYPVPRGAKHTPAKPAGPFYRLGPLSEEEEEALLEYLTFLRTRSNRRRGTR